jgi:hypothetical protein
MKMLFKKEVKHSVVYETDNEKAAVRSVYVLKDWINLYERVNGVWPPAIDLEIKVIP